MKWEDKLSDILGQTIHQAKEWADQATTDPRAEKLTEKLLQSVEKIKDQVDVPVEMAVFAKQYFSSPEKLSQLLESQSPDLAKKILDIASEFKDPYQIGMGFKVLQLEDEEVTVELPHRWRNRNEAGAMHTGALVALAEYTSRLFWERHLGPSQGGRLRLTDLRLTPIKEGFSAVKARLSLPGEECEQRIFEWRSRGESQLGSLVKIYNAKNHLVADVEVEWLASKAPLLESTIS